MRVDIDRPKTRADSEARARYLSGVKDYTPPEVDEATLRERAAMNVSTLAESSRRKAADSERLREESHFEECLAEVVLALRTREFTVTLVKATVVAAEQAVAKAEAALAPVEATIARSARDVADLQAALDRCDPAQLDRSRRLAEKVAAARTAEARVLPTRQAPAAALDTARAALNTVRAELAAAEAAVATECRSLADPVQMTKGSGRFRYTANSWAVTLGKLLRGEGVSEQDRMDAVTILRAYADAFGIRGEIAREVQREMRREINSGPIVLQPAGTFR